MVRFHPARPFGDKCSSEVISECGDSSSEGMHFALWSPDLTGANGSSLTQRVVERTARCCLAPTTLCFRRHLPHSAALWRLRGCV